MKNGKKTVILAQSDLLKANLHLGLRPMSCEGGGRIVFAEVPGWKSSRANGREG